jgi:hypothetical protein
MPGTPADQRTRTLRFARFGLAWIEGARDA